MQRIDSKAALVFLMLMTGCSVEQPTQSMDAVASASFNCETGESAGGEVVDVAGSGHTLYSKPDSSSQPVVNQKATAALGETRLHTIDSSTRVQVQCVSGEWRKVQLTEPEWMRHVGGWVEAKHLLLPTQSGALRTFTEADIYWDSKTTPHKAAIIEAVNRLHRDEPRCAERIDPGTVAWSASKSKPGVQVFFVTCGSGSAVENIFFTLD